MDNVSAAPTIVPQLFAIDYVVLCGLLSLSMGIGVYFGYFSKSKNTTEEYLLGGRKMKTIPIAISLIASQLSAIIIIGVPAEAYGYGSTFMLAIVPLLTLVAIFLNYAVLPVFYNTQIDSCYSYLELRISKSVKHLIIGIFFIHTLLFLPIYSFVPALSFAQVSGINIHVINAVVGMICVLYTMMGGIKAVVWTDVLQASVMIASIASIFVYAVVRIGGLEEIFRRAIAGGRLGATNWVLDLTTRQTMWNVSVGLFPTWVAHIGLNQSCVQRILALPTINHARNAIFLVCIGICAMLMTTSFIGVIIYAYYYNCDPIKSGSISQLDKLVPYFVNDLVGNIGGMPGLFITCVFSAALSTVSASLNSVAGIVYKDYICKIRGFTHSESKANVIMKSTIVVIGIYNVLMGFLLENSPSLFQVTFTLNGITQGVVFGLFTIGMFYPKANHRACIWATCITILFISFVFAVGQFYRNAYKISYELLPTSTDGCEARNISVTGQHLTTNTSSTHTEAENSIYNISFQWYSLIGATVFWILAILLSRIAGPQDVDKTVEPSLISSLAKFMMPKDNRHIEMQALDKTANQLIATDNKSEETTYKPR